MRPLPYQLKQYGWHLGIGLVMTITAIIFIFNVFRYNTYWAYDGGAHLQYILTIAKEGRLPTPDQNYLAWHEPLYYILNAGVVKILYFFSFSDSVIIKILQLESALFALFFIAGSGVLAWIITRDRARVFFVFLFSAALFSVSGVARYLTNEILFQTGTIWWLVWFFCGLNKADGIDKENKEYFPVWRWVRLSLGLLFLLWIKLTALVLIVAVVLWLLIQISQSVYQKSRSGNFGYQKIFMVILVCLIVAVGYSPWLYHKHRLYGESFTINNFESLPNKEATILPLSFYLTWDNTILQNPLWPGGRGSFWSLLFGSAFGDYDNVFQNYEPKQTQPTITTVNSRLFSTERFARMKLLLWLSLPLFIFLLFGLVRTSLTIIQKDWSKPTWFFLFIVTVGFLGSLVYNTWQYSFLERGTLKAIFILAFFPLSALMASAYLPIPKWRSFVWIYMSVWTGLSWSVILLPG